MDVLDEFWSLFNEGRLEDATALCSSECEYVDVQNFPEDAR